MHTQSRGTRRKTQAITLQRFAIKVDVKTFRDLDLDPRQTGAHKHVVDAKTVG
ncbi:hypothetical protein D3C84_1191430 [compost metagenome]